MSLSDIYDKFEDSPKTTTTNSAKVYPDILLYPTALSKRSLTIHHDRDAGHAPTPVPRGVFSLNLDEI